MALNKSLAPRVVLIIATLATTYAAIMPDYIKVCSRNDPQINECVKNTVHSMRPYLKDGIKELNVPAMEPLYIGSLNVLEGGASGLNMRVKKLNIYGASNFEIKKLTSSDNAKRFDFELNLPHLRGEGRYNLKGQILALPLQGNGPFTGNFTNFYAYVKVEFDVKKVNDVEYLTLKNLGVRIRTGKGNLHLENLFDGNQALGDIINQTVNDNFEIFTNEVIAPIARALEQKFSSIATKILENFTYNELFPIY